MQLTNFSKMSLVVSKGARICQLCPVNIKKGEKCYAVRVAGRMYYRNINIHAWHIKKINPSKCKQWASCLTGEFYCNSPICKLGRGHEKDNCFR